MTTTRLSPVVLGLLCIAVTIACGCESVTSRHDVEVNWLVDQTAVKTVGVTGFTWSPAKAAAPTGWSFSQGGDDTGLNAANFVTGALMKMNRYDLRERAQLAKVVEEQGLQLSDLVAKGDYERIGKLTGVDAVIVGNVLSCAMAMKDQPGMSVAVIDVAFGCRCVSTKTGSVLWSMGGSKSITFAQKLSPWMGMLTEELVAELREKLAHPPPSAK